MASANHKSRPVVTERSVTVQESGRHHSLSTVLRAIRVRRKLDTTYFPSIKLAGVWLEDAGFEVGERAGITVEDNRLIITPMLSAHCPWWASQVTIRLDSSVPDTPHR